MYLTLPYLPRDNEHIKQTGDDLSKLLGEIGKLESVRTDTARLNTGRMDTGRLGAMVKNTHHMVQQQQLQQLTNNRLNGQAMQIGLPVINGNGAAGGAIAAVRLLSGKDSPTGGGKSPRGSKSPTDHKSPSLSLTPFVTVNSSSTPTLSLASFGTSTTPTVRRSMDELPVGSSLTDSAAKLSTSQSVHDNSSMSLDMRLRNKQ